MINSIPKRKYIPTLVTLVTTHCIFAGHKVSGFTYRSITNPYNPYIPYTRSQATRISMSTNTNKITHSNIFTENKPKIVPKLIVFDLDNTLWTPELYQLNRRLHKENIKTPRANKDIRLFPDAVTVLSDIVQNPDCYQCHDETKMELAIASRTNKYAWAHSLLSQFQIPTSKGDKISLDELFPSSHIQIVKGSKMHHFQQLKEQTGIAYRDMLFFDDDYHMNCNEISSNLGILCCHCPNGITIDLFRESILKYSKIKEEGPDNIYMGYILNESSLGIALSTSNDRTKSNPIHQGYVKFYNPTKKFGFLQNQDGNDFFIHESKIPYGMSLTKGMKVTFEEIMDSKGRPSAIIVSSKKQNKKPTKVNEEMVEMPCFSMSQPFASLLLNKIKDIETRNNPMFESIKSGTRILLHCGKRDWHDLDAPIIEMQKAGYTESEIQQYSQLPKGFQKGYIIGVLQVGRTWLSSERERSGENMQKRVVAKTENIGKYCTIIEDAKWFKEPFVNARGKPGIFKVQIPKRYLE